MQPLTGGPRASLTETQVRRLLQSHAPIRISYGAVALDAAFGVVADVSDYMASGSSITSDVTATTQRTCTLVLDADVTDSGWSYLSGFIRPYQVFTDLESGVSAQFDLGVYTLTTPDRVLGTHPAQLSFAGYDLTYLLRQPVGDSFEVAAGSDPAQAAASVVGLAVPGVEVDVVPSGSTLPSQMTWPFNAAQPVLYIDVIDALLKSIGYREVWADWEGTFRIEPYVDLQAETAEWVFDTAAGDNIVADGRTQNIDIYDVPNWWRFVMANLTDTAQEGVSQFTWEDSSSTNPGSTANRGRVIRYIEEVAVTSYADLVNYAQSKIVATLAPAETFSVSTQPFPLAWHLDVISFHEAELSLALPVNGPGERRVLATNWQLPLDGRSDMTWGWRTISDEAATLGLAASDVPVVAVPDDNSGVDDNAGASGGTGPTVPGNPGGNPGPPATMTVRFGSGNMQGPYSTKDTASDRARMKQLKPGAELIKKMNVDIFFGCEFHADNDMDKLFLNNYLKPFDKDWALVRGDGGNSLLIRPSLYTATADSHTYAVGRNFTVFVVAEKATGNKTTIVGTHTRSNDDDGTKRDAERESEIREVAKYITDHGLKNVILVGDFNFKTDTMAKLRGIIKGAGGLVGLQARVPNIANGKKNSSTGSDDGRWIDDQFTRPSECTVAAAAGLVAGHASDHYLWDKATYTFLAVS